MPDRSHVHVEVPRVPFEKLADDSQGEGSAASLARAETPCARQSSRFVGTGLACNDDLGPKHVKDNYLIVV